MTSPGPTTDEARADLEARRARPLDRGFVITIVAATVIVLFLYAIRPILLPFVGAAIVAFVLSPVIRRLTPLMRGSRTLAAIALFAALVAIFVVAGFLAGPPLAAGMTKTISQAPTILQTTVSRFMGGRSVELMGQTMNAQQVSAAIIDAARKQLQNGGVKVLLGVAAGAMFTLVLGWVLLFYFLVGGPQLGEGLVRLLPPPHRGLAWRMWARVEPVLRRYFLGIFVVVAYGVVVAFVGLGPILHIRYAVLLAIFTGVLELIPVAGPITSAVVVGVVAVQQAAGVGAIVGFLIYALFLRLSIDQVVAPIVLGRAARVHPTMVIFCFLSGALLFNIVGVVFAVPVALAIKVALSTIYNEPPPGAEA